MTAASPSPAPLLALYHRAQTFGGSFNSVLDVLSRADRTRFTVSAAVPGPGNAADAIAGLGIPVRFLAERQGSRSPAYAAAVAAALVRLWRERPSLVYVSDYVTWRSSVLAAARLLGIATVVHVRSPLGGNARDPELLKATIVVGNSEATVRALRERRPGDSVRVVYNFVDFARFAGARDRRTEFFAAGTPVVGFLGVFRPEKGIEYFLQMAARLAASRPDIRFLAVGGESAVNDIGWFPKMRAHAQELGIGDRVHFTGSRDDVPDMMRSMDVLVVPSLNEGFGRVIIEANAVGIPVVGANAAGIPEVIEDGKTGLLVPPKDAEAMAAAVARLLDDDVWRRQMATALPSIVSARFAPARQMEELQRAWSDAIARI